MKSFHVDTDVICSVQTSVFSLSSNEINPESNFRYLVFRLRMNSAPCRRPTIEAETCRKNN